MSNSSATCGALHCTTATSIYSGPPVLMPAGASCRFHASLGMQSTSASSAHGRRSGSAFLLQPASMHPQCHNLTALFKWQLSLTGSADAHAAFCCGTACPSIPQQQPDAAQCPISLIGSHLQPPGW